jgi:hypothetical protein
MTPPDPSRPRVLDVPAPSLVAIGIQDGPTTSASWWAIALMFIGFLAALGGWALMPGPHQLTRRRERWERVGFPEE